MVYLFQNAFQYFKMGYAAALAWVLFAITLAITLIQLRLSRYFVYAEGAR
jgi:multiple sugar transport system permease protein